MFGKKLHAAASRSATEPRTIQVAGREIPLRVRRHASARRIVLRIDLDSGGVALTLTLLDLLPNELGDPARRFEYLSHGGLVVETQSGKRARFGDAW